MKIQEAPLPPELEAASSELLPEISEYLELEEGGVSSTGLRYSSYFTVDDLVAFVVFEYTSDHGPSFAFVQYSLARGVEESGCVGCWPRTEGETIAWSIAEFLEMNPIRDE